MTNKQLSQVEKMSLAWRRALGAVVGVLVLMGPAAAAQSPEAERLKIERLPGVDGTVRLSQYAGRLPVDRKNNGKMFFWLVEADRDAANKPLVIWLNGGPGASSLNGLLWGNGPLTMAPSGKLSPSLYGWNKLANMLYVDQPLGTGLSQVDAGGRVRTRDKVVADFYDFLVEFYRLFPDYRTRPLFLAGESFAGHYIPDFARAILDRKNTPGGLQVQLAGLAIGSGWFDPVIQLRSNIDYAYAAGIIGDDGKAAAEKTFIDIQKQIEAGTANENTFGQGLGRVLAYSGTKTVAVNIYDIRSYEKNAGMDWPAATLKGIGSWLSRPDVLRALHAQPQAAPFQGFSEPICGDLQRYYYSSSSEVLAGLLAEVPVLVFAGQWDFMSNHLGQERVLAALKWPGQQGFAAAPRSVWLIGEQPAGYVRSHQNLIYLQVLGAGHVVSYSAPGPALDMFGRFLSGKGFADYSFGK